MASDKTGIGWTDATWNPIVGCSIVSPGCTNCYAMKMAARLEAMGQPIYRGMTQPSKAGPVWSGKIDLSNWGQAIKPLSWKRPRRIFVNSMSDLFHESLPDEAIDKVFAVMALCPHHTFQVLTKRPARMKDYIERLTMNRLRDCVTPGEWPRTRHETDAWLDPAATPEHRALYRAALTLLPLPNVWLGVSTEDQKRADERIPHLLRCPAAVRFISAEPLLGPIDLRFPEFIPWECAGGPNECEHGYAAGIPCPKCLPQIDWVIVGGESGPGARPCNVEWIRSIIGQCKAAGVPVFVKQLGAYWAKLHSPMRRVRNGFERVRKVPVDPKGGDPAEWPADLRVREFPATAAAGATR
jgi:protein gp37